MCTQIIPHFSEECNQIIGGNLSRTWPEIDKDKLKTNKVNFVIQFNGKKKGILNTKLNIKQDELIEYLMSDKNYEKIFFNKKIENCFFVKNKIINIILK